MGHSHPAGWNPPDSYAFAKSVVETGKPWGSSPSAKTESGTAIAVFHSTKPLTRAVLVSTTDKGFTGTRKWVESPAMAASGGGNGIRSARGRGSGLGGQGSRQFLGHGRRRYGSRL